MLPLLPMLPFSILSDSPQNHFLTNSAKMSKNSVFGFAHSLSDDDHENTKRVTCKHSD